MVIELVWRSYILLQRYILKHFCSLVKFDFEGRIACTRDAQRLFKYAKSLSTPEGLDDLVHSLCESHFQKGKDFAELT
jgi:predicted DsbA family dithiol-disulfide isomerase